MAAGVPADTLCRSLVDISLHYGGKMLIAFSPYSLMEQHIVFGDEIKLLRLCRDPRSVPEL